MAMTNKKKEILAFIRRYYCLKLVIFCRKRDFVVLRDHFRSHCLAPCRFDWTHKMSLFMSYFLIYFPNKTTNSWKKELSFIAPSSFKPKQWVVCEKSKDLSPCRDLVVALLGSHVTLAKSFRCQNILIPPNFYAINGITVNLPQRWQDLTHCLVMALSSHLPDSAHSGQPDAESSQRPEMWNARTNKLIKKSKDLFQKIKKQNLFQCRIPDVGMWSVMCSC